MSLCNRMFKSSQALIDLYESMDAANKKSLSDYADFLYAKAVPVKKIVPLPEDLPRPQVETVVGAIKRLKAKYHMIDSMSVFSAASSLMTDNMVKGRDVAEVIDEMEVLFDRAYKKLRDSNDVHNSNSNRNSE